MTNIPFIEEDGGKASKWALLAAHFNVGGFESEDCDPISDKEFKLLMALVGVATVAFGCIVHGWLI
jgi:hypothetical protein